MTGRRRITLTIALLSTVLLPSAHTSGRAPKRAPCRPGRFLVDISEAPLLGGASTPEPDAVVFVAPRELSLGTECPAVNGKVVAKRKFTHVAVTWPACGERRRVRLTGKIPSPACEVLEGQVKGRHLPAKKFTARRSLCGDGVVDTGGDEQCEP